MADAPTLGLTPRADVLDDLLPADDDDKEKDPRIWSALALAYGAGGPCRLPLSDPHVFPSLNYWWENGRST